MNLVLKAIKFANKKHAGQFRKVSGDEYVSHPIAVSYIVAAFKKSGRIEELLAASILHDVLEDTDTTFIELVEEFTPLIASLVLEVTNDDAKIKEIGKLEYQKKKLVGISNYGLVIKLADRLHNISDSPSKQMILDTADLIDYLVLNRKLTTTHTRLLNEIVKAVV